MAGRLLAPDTMSTGARPVAHAWLEGDLQMTASHATGLLEVNGVRGFLSEGDVLQLHDHARAVRPGGSIVEIGSFMGLSAIVLAIGLVDSGNFTARIHCVDTWAGSPEHGHLEIVRRGRLYDLFLANVEDAGIAALVHPIRLPSVEAARRFAPASVDLLFVDGDHSEEAASADLRAWWPTIRPGGTVLGHDCAPGGGVERALRRFVAEERLTYEITEPPLANYLFSLLRPAI